jgi:hypothetical protein
MTFSAKTWETYQIFTNQFTYLILNKQNLPLQLLLKINIFKYSQIK